MSYLDESDPFDSIVREFFGRNRNSEQNNETIIQGEDDEREIDFIEDAQKIYLIFELPGYSKNDIMVVVKNDILEISAQKQNGENMQNYLAQKLRRGAFIKKTLPRIINTKKMTHTMSNGILEIIFEKKK